MWKFIIDQQKKEKKSNQMQDFYVFSNFRPVFGPDGSKNGPISKVITFILRDTSNHWLSATQKKFDLDNTIAKTDF